MAETRPDQTAPKLVNPSKPPDAPKQLPFSQVTPGKTLATTADDKQSEPVTLKLNTEQPSKSRDGFDPLQLPISSQSPQTNQDVQQLPPVSSNYDPSTQPLLLTKGESGIAEAPTTVEGDYRQRGNKSSPLPLSLNHPARSSPQPKPLADLHMRTHTPQAVGSASGHNAVSGGDGWHAEGEFRPAFVEMPPFVSPMYYGH